MEDEDEEGMRQWAMKGDDQEFDAGDDSDDVRRSYSRTDLSIHCIDSLRMRW